MSGATRRPTPAGALRTRRQAGVTLVELMVALVIGLVVSAAAVAALIVARNGFNAVDSTAQLRENARFSADLMQRLAVQAGFEDVAGGQHSTVPPAGKLPSIQGYDDALMPSPASDSLVDGSRSAGCGGVTDTSCANGSDALVLRFWGTSRNGVADGSMINCAGVGEAEGTERATSIFHIVRSAAGEPTLACTYRAADGTWKTEALVPGVEALQVLYGVDNVVPGVAPPAGSSGTDSVPDRYLRASELVVAGNPVETANNWRRVRSLRMGLLFRGPAGTAIDRDAVARTYNVLGDGLSAGTDTLARLPVPADGRLRQTLVMNIHLRNP
jgi:type IV pilus assembly protein PilW